mmetsp:Transcript_57280/g.159432  ORF Transcript_57280/g.159432 Transcript_57280/m.159432 type:complete len:109 (-) Transcript_57280:274-600(-)
MNDSLWNNAPSSSSDADTVGAHGRMVVLIQDMLKRTRPATRCKPKAGLASRPKRFIAYCAVQLTEVVFIGDAIKAPPSTDGAACRARVWGGSAPLGPAALAMVKANTI